MVLVTGATGILGRVIVLELLKRGENVRATKRKSSDLAEVKKSFRFYTDQPDRYFEKIMWSDVDFDDLNSLEEALMDVQDVYHCAAKVSFHPQDEKEMFQLNIDGTKNLLVACQNSSVRKFCFVSSIAVLDGVNESGELDENADYDVKNNHSAYAVSKHLSEMEVWRANAEGLNTVIVNPGIIVGSGNWHESSGLLFENLSRGYTFSGGSSYIDVRDVAKVCVKLMENSIFGERFILISENKRYSEVGAIVRKKLGKPAPKVIPPSLLVIGRVLNFLLGWLVPVLKMVDRVNTQSVTSFPVVSNKKIIDKLNIELIPVSESIDFHFPNYFSDTKK